MRPDSRHDCSPVLTSGMFSSPVEDVRGENLDATTSIGGSTESTPLDSINEYEIWLIYASICSDIGYMRTSVFVDVSAAKLAQVQSSLDRMLSRLWGASPAEPPQRSLSRMGFVERSERLRKALKALEMVMNDDVPGAKAILEEHDDAFYLTARASTAFYQAALSFNKNDLIVSADQLRKALGTLEIEYSYATLDFVSQFPRGSEYECSIANTLLQLAIIGFLSESVGESMKAVFKLKRAYKIFSTLYGHMKEHGVYIPLEDDSQLRPDADNSQLRRAASMISAQESVTLKHINTSHMDQATGVHTTLNSIDYFVACNITSGYGLLSLIISLVPPTVSRVLSIVGFLGDRQDALSVYWKGAFAANFQGSIALLALLTYYGGLMAMCDIGENTDTQLAQLNPMLISARSRYPASAIWALQSAKMQQQSGDMNGSIDVLQSLTSKSNTKQIESLRCFELGNSYLLTLQWERAVDCFTRLEQANDWSKSHYHFVIGSCFTELYRATNSQEYATKADYHLLTATTSSKRKIMGKSNPLEVYMKRKVTKWQTRSKNHGLISGMTVSPILEYFHLFNFWKRMTRNSQESCLKIAGVRGSIDDSADDTLSRQLMVSALQRNLKDWTCFDTIRPASLLSRNDLRDAHAEIWALPWVYYEQAACWWSRDGMRSESEVRYWIEKAKSFGESELGQRLSIRLSTALNTLEQAKVERV